MARASAGVTGAGRGLGPVGGTAGSFRAGCPGLPPAGRGEPGSAPRKVLSESVYSGSGGSSTPGTPAHQLRGFPGGDSAEGTADAPVADVAPLGAQLRPERVVGRRGPGDGVHRELPPDRVLDVGVVPLPVQGPLDGRGLRAHEALHLV